MLSYIFVALVAAGVVLLLVGVTAAVSSVTRPVTRSFRCPLVERPVTVEFAQEVWRGELVDVTRCSAFEDLPAISCGKPCLRLAWLPTAAEAAAFREF